MLADAGVKARSHKGVRDQVAAQLILQTYFDQRDGD
jgi:RNase H-fold protein (predicted Holliday junction resolvase)